MKHVKMLGLAAAAAAALMAIVGAGSASADRLCSQNQTPCEAANVMPAGTIYTATLKEGTEMKWSAGFSNIRCTSSSVELEQTSAGGGAGVGVEYKVKSLSFGGCNSTFNVIALGAGRISYTSEMSGSIAGSGTRLEIVAGTTKCFYGGEITEGLNVTGGAPATAMVINVKLARETGSSALCANPAKWNAEYVFGQTAYIAES